MKRREFFGRAALGTTTLGAAGFGAILTGNSTGLAAEEGEKRDYIDWRTFWAHDEAERNALAEKIAKKVIPNRKKLGFDQPIGLFTVREDLHADDAKFDPKFKKAVFLLVASPSVKTLVNTNDAMMEEIADADRLVVSGEEAPYFDSEASLLYSVPFCPKLEVPTFDPERILQIRYYFSPGMERNRAKRNMFGPRGELDLFRRCGMPPVFFTETVFGLMMPNLVYMLSFSNDEARKTAWNTFIQSPEWKQMSGEPEFKNTATRILNLFLRPCAGSEI